MFFVPRLTTPPLSKSKLQEILRGVKTLTTGTTKIAYALYRNHPELPGVINPRSHVERLLGQLWEVPWPDRWSLPVNLICALAYRNLWAVAKAYGDTAKIQIESPGLLPSMTITIQGVALSDNTGPPVLMGDYTLTFLKDSLTTKGFMTVTGGRRLASGHIHPHVGGSVCYGESLSMAEDLIKRGCIPELVALTEAVLRSYNPGGAYMPLPSWRTVSPAPPREGLVPRTNLEPPAPGSFVSVVASIGSFVGVADPIPVQEPPYPPDGETQETEEEAWNCGSCSNTFTVTEGDPSYRCDHCYEDVCEACYYGDCLCTACYDNHYGTCGHCGRVGLREELSYCRDCSDYACGRCDSVTSCEECNEAVCSDHSRTMACDHVLCLYCYERDNGICNRCDRCKDCCSCEEETLTEGAPTVTQESEAS